MNFEIRPLINEHGLRFYVRSKYGRHYYLLLQEPLKYGNGKPLKRKYALEYESSHDSEIAIFDSPVDAANQIRVSYGLNAKIDRVLL